MSDPKRPPTFGAEERTQLGLQRDLRSPKTPPRGIAQQIAGPVSPFETKSSVDGESFEAALHRRTKEWRDKVADLDVKITKVEGKVDATDQKLDMALVFLDRSDKERERRAQREADVFKYQLDAQTAEHVASINVQPRTIRARGAYIAGIISALLVGAVELVKWLVQR